MAGMTTHPSDQNLTANASLSDLLDASEDIPSFLNDIISPSTTTNDLSQLEKTVSELLTRLSILGQDTSAELEDSIHDISRNVPRLTYDLQFMRESAESVRQSLQTVQYRVKGIGGQNEYDDHTDAERGDTAQTKQVLDRLTHLDLLKTRMEESRDVLREAESWSTLESETLAFLSGREYRKAANRLHEASVSILVFQNTPAEFGERRAVLTSLQNELETRLMVKLGDMIKKEEEGEVRNSETAISGAEVAGQSSEVDEVDLPEMYRIFGLIEREKEFRTGYFRARRARLMDNWESTVTVESGISSGTGPALPLSQLLVQTLSILLQMITSESAKMTHIFPDSSSTLGTFLQTTLESLNPSISDRLGQLMEHHGQQAIIPLIECWEHVETFGKSAKEVFDRMAPDVLPAGGAGSTVGQATGAKAGRRSRASSISSIGGVRPVISDRPAGRRMSRILGEGSMSISGTATILPPLASALDAAIQPASVSPWEAPLYEPFLDYQSDYEGLEKRFFLSRLRRDPSFSKTAVLNDDPAVVVLARSRRAIALADTAISRCIALTHGYGLAGLYAAVDFLLDTSTKESDIVLDIIGLGKSVKAKEAALSDTSLRDELDDLGELESDDYGPFEAGLKVLQSCKATEAILDGLGDRLTEQASATKQEMVHLRGGGIVAPDANFVGPRILLQQSSLNSLALATVLDSSDRRALLPASRKALSNFTGQAQVSLQRIILTPMYAQLASYASLPVWSQPEKIQRKGELYVPTFSLSPTDTISHVAEKLLNLLRLFEVYAGEEALEYSLETLPFVDAQTLRDLADEQQRETGRRSASPSTSPSLKAHSSSLAITTTTPAKSVDQAISFPPEVVLSTWISSLALSLLAHLTRTILPSIRSPLTIPGNAQLASDLGYLSNAIRALDVEWEELEQWRAKAEEGSGASRTA